MAIHRFEIVSGIQADTGDNPIACCLGCQRQLVTFKNIHNSDLNITDFTIDLTGWSAGAVTIVEINGATPSFPFLVAEGDTFTIDFLFCPGPPLPTPVSWEGTIVTNEHGDDLSWTFNHSCVDVEDMFLSTTFDFTGTQVGVTNVQCITVANTSFTDIEIEVLTSGCGSPEPIQTPSIATIIPAYGSAQVCLEWTPTSPSETPDCTTTIRACSSIIIDIVGTAVEEPCDCLCCLDIEIQTDGGYLSPSSGFCSPDVLYSKASFLDKKTVVYNMRYEPGLVTGFRLQFNPALFIFDCESPFELNQQLPTGYYIQYLSGAHPDGIAQQMTLNGATSNALNLKNWEVYFRPVDAINGYFNVEFTFYLIQDYENFITNLLWNNAPKVRRTTLSTSSDWTNTFPSVYNSNKKYLSGAFYMSDPATLVGDSPFACNQITCSNFAARFYNKGINNAASEFLLPQFTLSRANGVVNNFSVLEPTRITFKVIVPPIHGATAPVIVYHLFDTSASDDTVDFLTATDSSRYRVLTYPGTAVLNNHLVAPGGTPYLSGAYWECFLYVGTSVNPTSVYRVAAIVYGSNGEMVNTFLSEEIRVTRFPDMDCDCVPDFDSNFVQYWQKTNTECFQPVAKERIGHDLTLSEGDFGDCLADLGVDNLFWPRQLKSVRLKIYKRKDNFPTVGKTTFFEYETHYSERDYAYPGNFHNYNNLIVADAGPSIGDDVLTSIRNIRVPWEYIPFQPGQVSTSDTATYLNRTPAGGLTNSYITSALATQTWTNEDVYFEYTFEFDLFPQIGVPFFWKTVKAFKVNAIEIEPNNGGYDQVITDVVIEGKDKITGLYQEIEAPICFADWDAIRLTYEADREGNFIFFMEKDPFGFPTIVENNEALSLWGMSELNNPLVLSMDTAFDPVTFKASVVLDAPNFDNGKYRFCGYISFPEAAVVCEYFIRHDRINSSSNLTMPILVLGDTIPVTFNNTNASRFLYISSKVGETTFPVVGETYVIEYSFNVPTTRIIELYMGQFTVNGIPTLTLPIGTTSGSFSFVWSGLTSGEWSIVTKAGTNMTNTATFKLGNALCP
jgi:hypothetical protein